MNPILPLQEYIPDGEPHVFGDRIYLFGSHDVAGGKKYCEAGNYVVWSAPVTDMTDWRCDGEIYRAQQDPAYGKEGGELYAPDVVQGNDGRFYLYYNLVSGTTSGFNSGLHVAVSDLPAGKYEYLGVLKNPDGSMYSSYLLGDPAVINDDGVIRVYAGWSLSMVAQKAHRSGTDGELPLPYQMPEEQMYPVYEMLFGKSKEEIDELEYPLMGANTFTLADDMLTVNSEVRRIVEGQFATAPDSGFYGHAFYEASSIRKINGVYYFIYSSENSNELCYAVSRFPDKDFVYGGTIISNGDVGYEGRKNEDRLNMTGNNHGSIEYVNGEYYIFYHRQTNRSTFSRQACAERITIAADGSIAQVECTSEGIGQGHLKAEGKYPAAVCCNLTNGQMPHCTNTEIEDDIPYITQTGNEVYIANIGDGTRFTYKYFEFRGKIGLCLATRGKGKGCFTVLVNGKAASKIAVEPDCDWNTYTAEFSAEEDAELTFEYRGTGKRDVSEIWF